MVKSGIVPNEKMEWQPDLAIYYISSSQRNTEGGQTAYTGYFGTLLYTGHFVTQYKTCGYITVLHTFLSTVEGRC